MKKEKQNSLYPAAYFFLGHCPSELTPCSKKHLIKHLNRLISENVRSVKDLKNPDVVKAQVALEEIKSCSFKGKKYFPQKQTTIKQQVKSTLKNFFFSD